MLKVLLFGCLGSAVGYVIPLVCILCIQSFFPPGSQEGLTFLGIWCLLLTVPAGGISGAIVGLCLSLPLGADQESIG